MSYLVLTTVLPIFTLISFPSPSKNGALLKRFYKEVYEDWNMEMVDEVLSAEFFSHDWPEGQKGPEAFRNYYAALKKAVPDARYKVQDLIADGDRVVVRWEMHGTHKGSFPGIDIAPTGQTITLKGIALYRIEKGKLMERWVVSDLHGLLEEIRPSSQP